MEKNMNILDALLRIAECWALSTDEKFNMHDLTGVFVDSFGDIEFCMRGCDRYRICHDSCFVEKYNVWKGYVRV